MLTMDSPSETHTSYGLRKRSVGVDSTTPNSPLNVEFGYKIVDGSMKAIPSPCIENRMDEDQPSSSLAEFRKKQQSFDFEVHIEDCDEEELSIDGSDDESSRPHTPMEVLQFPDSGGNVTHKEQPSNFLQVDAKEPECVTDISEGESENEDEMAEASIELPKRTVIKRVPH